MSNYFQHNKRILLVVHSFCLGGGNFWCEQLSIILETLGYDVSICYHCEIRNSQKNYFISEHCEKPKNIFLYKKGKIDFDLYKKVILNNIVYENLSEFPNTHFFIMSHSDVAFMNSYIKQNIFLPHVFALCLNNVTKNKLLSIPGVTNEKIFMLRNWVQHLDAKSMNDKTFDIHNPRLLYVNRISNDKNIQMILFSLKMLLDTYQNASVTILLGGVEYTPTEMYMIDKTLQYLGIHEKITLLPSQKDVHSYYLKHDFCFLASVSEGCSYNILESINAGVPIVTSKIEPNVEILQDKMPYFELVGINDCNQSLFSIENYNQQLEILGYICHGNLCADCMYEINTSGFDNVTVFNPYILDNLQNKMCKKCKLFVYERQKYFHANVIKIFQGFVDMIEHFQIYKKNILQLKEILTPTYFSNDKIRNEIIQMLQN
jgi:glycosyltransferase involved in cell wall biosynthesis